MLARPERAIGATDGPRPSDGGLGIRFRSLEHRAFLRRSRGFVFEFVVQRQFDQHVSAALSQPYYLDVTHPKANKGEVVNALSAMLAIPTAQIATIGDMPNDVLMFQRSGVSIAMGNASVDVQRAATFVTASNREEGFALAMERFVLRAQTA